MAFYKPKKENKDALYRIPISGFTAVMAAGFGIGIHDLPHLDAFGGGL